jgi:penicillin amidase
MADLRAPGFHAAGVTLPGCPLWSPGTTSTWPGALPRSTPTCRTSTWRSWTARAITRLRWKLEAAGRGSRADSRARRQGCGTRCAIDRARAAAESDVQRETRPIALKWTLYDPALNALPLYEMNTRRTGIGVFAALACGSWPTQNVVYSDDQGHIAYHAVGRVPLRPGGPAGRAHSRTRRTSGRGTFPLTRCPMRSIRLRVFWPQPTRA